MSLLLSTTKRLNWTLQKRLTSSFFESSKYKYRSRESRDCLLLSEDGTTFIAYHPSVDVPFADTKPVEEAVVANQRTLSEEETKMVKELHAKNSRIWTNSVLAKLFDVDQRHIAALNPMSEAEWDRLMTQRKQETEFVQKMKPYERKRYAKQKEEKKRRKLREAIASLNYNFPGKLNFEL